MGKDDKATVKRGEYVLSAETIRRWNARSQKARDAEGSDMTDMLRSHRGDANRDMLGDDDDW